MKSFKNRVDAEYYPDALDIAEAFWSMEEEEQCYFFEHLYQIAGSKLAQQLQFVVDSEFFSVEAAMALSTIGDYSQRGNPDEI
jgi:alpha-amylase/alpha-mannosidase (GH57 family)